MPSYVGPPRCSPLAHDGGAYDTALRTHWDGAALPGYPPRAARRDLRRIGCAGRRGGGGGRDGCRCTGRHRPTLALDQSCSVHIWWKVRPWLARYLPFLRRSATVYPKTAGGVAVVGAAGVRATGSVWNPDAPLEDQVRLLHEQMIEFHTLIFTETDKARAGSSGGRCRSCAR